jgi:hypothetical protein
VVPGGAKGHASTLIWSIGWPEHVTHRVFVEPDPGLAGAQRRQQRRR